MHPNHSQCRFRSDFLTSFLAIEGKSSADHCSATGDDEGREEGARWDEADLVLRDAEGGVATRSTSAIWSSLETRGKGGKVRWERTTKGGRKGKGAPRLEDDLEL